MNYSKVQFCFKNTLTRRQRPFMRTDVCKLTAEVQEVSARVQQKHKKSQSCDCASADVGQITLKVQHLAMISGH